MAGSLIELFDTRTETISNDSKGAAVLQFMAINCANEDEVRTLVVSDPAIPATYAGLVWKSTEIASRINNTTWRIVVNYVQADLLQNNTDQPVLSFDTTGGMQHVTQSISTVNSYGDAPDFGGAIGYDGENVSGVDITQQAFTWQETHYLDDGDVDFNTYYALTGFVNSDTFRGFDAGSVLFLGVSGQRRGQGKWELTFKFSASLNRTGFSVGAISGINKKGWEYMWVRYAEDVVSNARIKKPVAVYIEKVYDTGPLNSLGIPDPF